ncbi:MAG: hypothetical protein EXR98_19780 [Gemmataceae bacterium]|nr:hypothetical protein [Gemmataceae bacterium]
MKRSIILDDGTAKVGSGAVSESIVKLKLTAPSKAKSITYLSSRDWDGKSSGLLFGANGIAALTFSEVPIDPAIDRKTP